MDLSALTGNPIVKNLLMKQLKKIIAENDIKMITIIPNAAGEIDFELYQTESVVVDKTEFFNLINSIKQ